MLVSADIKKFLIIQKLIGHYITFKGKFPKQIMRILLFWQTSLFINIKSCLKIKKYVSQCVGENLLTAFDIDRNDNII